MDLGSSSGPNNLCQCERGSAASAAALLAACLRLLAPFTWRDSPPATKGAAERRRRVEAKLVGQLLHTERARFETAHRVLFARLLDEVLIGDRVLGELSLQGALPDSELLGEPSD